METKKEKLSQFERMLIGEPILVSKNYPMKEILNTSNRVVIEDCLMPETEYPVETWKDEAYRSHNTTWLPINNPKATCKAGFIIANAILDLARVQQESAQQVAEAIITSSSNIAYSIRQVADEMERKNKLDEYYMLLDKIEQYEEELINRGVIKETYENMAIIKYPTINLDERCQYLLLTLQDEERATLLATTKKNGTHPIKVLENILSSTPNSWFGIEESHKVVLLKKERFEIPWVKWKIKEDGVYLTKEAYEIKIGRLAFCGGTKKGEETFYKLALLGYETMGKRLIEFVYNSINDEEIAKMKLNKRYPTLTSELDAINRDVQLANLRILYFQLRSALRTHKINESKG